MHSGRSSLGSTVTVSDYHEGKYSSTAACQGQKPGSVKVWGAATSAYLSSAIVGTGSVYLKQQFLLVAVRQKWLKCMSTCRNRSTTNKLPLLLCLATHCSDSLHHQAVWQSPLLPAPICKCEKAKYWRKYWKGLQLSTGPYCDIVLSLVCEWWFCLKLCQIGQLGCSSFTCSLLSSSR